MKFVKLCSGETVRAYEYGNERTELSLSDKAQKYYSECDPYTILELKKDSEDGEEWPAGRLYYFGSVPKHEALRVLCNKFRSDLCAEQELNCILEYFYDCEIEDETEDI